MSSITTSNIQHSTHDPNKSVAKLSIQKIDFLWNRETSIIHGIHISTADRPHEPHKGYLVKFYSFSFKLSLCICDTLSCIQVTNVTHFSNRAQPYKRAFRQSSNFHAFKKTSPFQTTFNPVYLVWNRNIISEYNIVHIKRILWLMAKYRGTNTYLSSCPNCYSLNLILSPERN